MLKSYVKIALRNLYKNKLYSVINIVGLGVAIACSIVAYVNYQYSRSMDNFHENADKIYTINSYRILNDSRQNWSLTPLPMTPELSEKTPGIEKFSRISSGSGTMRYGDKVFNEYFHFVDKDFFEMFTFPLKAGNKNALAEKSAIVISEEIAEKYFGDDDPLGKQVAISAGSKNDVSFIVRGVVENTPSNSTIQLSILLPYQNWTDFRGIDPQDWGNWARASLIQIADNASPVEIEEQLHPYLKVANDANPDWEIKGFYLLPFTELAAHARELRGDPFKPGVHGAALMGPTITALLVLLLACFNFVNTAIAFASRRLKEIGIRKVVGGMRSQLIFQFLGENLVLCFIALIAGIGLGHLFVPVYDSLWPDMSLSFNYMENIGFLGFFAVLLFLTGIAAGAYPAFYISAFKPVNILKGKQKLGGTNPLIRVLLTFQFALSMTAIITGIILHQNGEFFKNYDMGFDREQILVVPVNGEEEYNILKNAISQHPDITGIAGSRNLIGRSWSIVNIESGRTDAEVESFSIGENYLETQGLELLRGRKFDPQLKTDIDQAVMVNETMVKQFGWDNPLDKRITIKTSDAEKVYHVIGVVKDFHYNSFWRKIQPVILQYSAPEAYQYLTFKFDTPKLQAMSQYIQTEWKRLFPAQPYDGFFMDEVQAGTYRVNESIRLIFLYIAIIAVLIAGMGLFALVSLNIAKRTREIGIRKILGASMTHIGGLISREFILLMVIASGIAVALGYYLVSALLSSIWAYYVDFGAVPFIAAPVLVALVAILTVSSQVYRVTTANPVEAIREE